MSRAYKVVDVFTSQSLLGNPVAVVLNASGLDAATMQAIARWTNLSETTFVLPPDDPAADYRLRIFTPNSELPFAGHPTLGSAYAILESGLVSPKNGVVIQQCGVGLIQIKIEGEAGQQQLTFDLPDADIRLLTTTDIDELEAALATKVMPDTPPAVINVGAIWVVAQLSSAQDVLRLQPDMALMMKLEHRLGATGTSVFGCYEHGETDIEVRSFAPSSGVNEDPVCGSGNGSIAVFQQYHGIFPRGLSHAYTASQGACVGRAGRVSVRMSAEGQVSIGGQCVTCIEGLLDI